MLSFPLVYSNCLPIFSSSCKALPLEDDAPPSQMTTLCAIAKMLAILFTSWLRSATSPWLMHSASIQSVRDVLVLRKWRRARSRFGRTGNMYCDWPESGETTLTSSVASSSPHVYDSAVAVSAKTNIGYCSADELLYLQKLLAHPGMVRKFRPNGTVLDPCPVQDAPTEP